jgi:hypothetical protein
MQNHSIKAREEAFSVCQGHVELRWYQDLETRGYNVEWMNKAEGRAQATKMA